MPADARPLFSPRRDAARELTSDGRPMLVRATTDETEGLLRVVEMREEFRPRVPLHAHRYPEAWYILDGVYGFHLDGRWRRAMAGTFVFAPAGRPHALTALPGARGHKISLMLMPDPSGERRDGAFAIEQLDMIEVPWVSLLTGACPAERGPSARPLAQAAAESVEGAEHLFDAVFKLDVPLTVDGGEAAGSAMVVRSIGGRFEGPGCGGVVQSATDWARRQRNGDVAVDIRAVLESADGTPMLLELRGVGMREGAELTIVTEGRLEASPEGSLGRFAGAEITAIGGLAEGGVSYAIYRTPDRAHPLQPRR